jgi:hypothetical protein
MFFWCILIHGFGMCAPADLGPRAKVPTGILAALLGAAVQPGWGIVLVRWHIRRTESWRNKSVPRCCVVAVVVFKSAHAGSPH